MVQDLNVCGSNHGSNLKTKFVEYVQRLKGGFSKIDPLDAHISKSTKRSSQNSLRKDNKNVSFRVVSPFLLKAFMNSKVERENPKGGTM